MNILGIGFALAAGVFFGIIGPVTKTAYNLGAGVGLAIFLRYIVALLIVAPLIPYRYKTYIYKKETDYYDMWQNSLFGVSHAYNNWFESVRYYEMLMNGCIPLILNLKKCPVDTLTQLPKKELFDVFNKYSWILNKYFPLSIYKKNFLSFEKFYLYFKDIFKKKYDSESFINEFPEINDIRNNLLVHTRKFLTTEFTANYIINTTNKFYL